MTMQTKFPEVTKAEWLAKVEKDLRGKPLGELDFEVAGANFSPIHHSDDHPTRPEPVRTTSGCLLGAKIEVTDPAEANRMALEALVGGANYIYFVDPDAFSAEDREQRRALLYKDILTDIVDVVWHDSPKPFLTYTLDTVADQLFTMSLVVGTYPSATLWFETSDDYLQNIAALRAIRLCLNLIKEETTDDFDFKIGAFVKGDPTDPNSAKIRSAAQAKAAIIGGADILLIEPSDGVGESPFERRIARNIQHLLIEESHLNVVADPAAGSYYIETLTDHLAQKIWTEFQHIYSEASNDGGNEASNDRNSV
jgi:hypothetical protein